METELCKIAYKYGTDKCPRIFHTYTPYYYELLKDKNIKKVLEMGIGDTTYRDRLAKHDKAERTPVLGASLLMWRDFFPKAQIFGADIDQRTMFDERHIRTLICDETDVHSIKSLIQHVGNDVDLFIDDGLHAKENQAFLAKKMLPLLKKDVIYIIEDVGFPNYIKEQLVGYVCEEPKLEGTTYHKNRLIRVYNK